MKSFLGIILAIFAGFLPVFAVCEKQQKQELVSEEVQRKLQQIYDRLNLSARVARIVRSGISEKEEKSLQNAAHFSYKWLFDNDFYNYIKDNAPDVFSNEKETFNKKQYTVCSSLFFDFHDGKNPEKKIDYQFAREASIRLFNFKEKSNSEHIQATIQWAMSEVAIVLNGLVDSAEQKKRLDKAIELCDLVIKDKQANRDMKMRAFCYKGISHAHFKNLSHCDLKKARECLDVVVNEGLPNIVQAFELHQKDKINGSENFFWWTFMKAYHWKTGLIMHDILTQYKNKTGQERKELCKNNKDLMDALTWLSKQDYICPSTAIVAKIQLDSILIDDPEVVPFYKEYPCFMYRLCHVPGKVLEEKTVVVQNIYFQ